MLMDVLVKADELLARNIVLTMWMNGLLMASILLKRTHPCLTRPLRLRRRRWSLVVVVFLLVQDFGVLLPLLMETLQQLH